MTVERREVFVRILFPDYVFLQTYPSFRGKEILISALQHREATKEWN
jgi:hypothetical protein